MSTRRTSRRSRRCSGVDVSLLDGGAGKPEGAPVRFQARPASPADAPAARADSEPDDDARAAEAPASPPAAPAGDTAAIAPSMPVAAFRTSVAMPDRAPVPVWVWIVAAWALLATVAAMVGFLG